MKIKTLVAMLFLSAGATTVVAQDASNCNSNSSISHEAVRAGNFKDAYTPWKAVYYEPSGSFKRGIEGGLATLTSSKVVTL